MNFAPVELLVVAAIVCVLLLPIMAVRNALQASESQWAAIGESRTMWLVLIIGGTLLGGFFGLFLSAFYLLKTRPKLAAAREPAGVLLHR